MEDNVKLTPDMFELLPDSEKNAELITIETKTYLQDAWGRFKKNKLALIGFVFLVIMILFAIFAPMLSQYSYDQQNLDIQNQMPSMAHFFGTDKFGRDIFVRVAYGARISLSIGFAAAAINLIIGVVYGGICGYFGGKIDMFMMRIVDIIYSMPDMLYVIMIMLIMPDQPIVAILLGISIASWIGMARQVRTQVMTLKQQEFSLAAFVLGASKSRILFKHLIINCMGPIIVSVTLMVPSAIFTEAFLSFVGIGITVPMASWGSLANDARALLESYPIQVIWPVAAICLTMLSLNFIGDGLGDALDPKKK